MKPEKVKPKNNAERTWEYVMAMADALPETYDPWLLLAATDVLKDATLHRIWKEADE